MESTIIYFEEGKENKLFTGKVLEMCSLSVISFVLWTQDPWISANLPLISGDRCKCNPKWPTVPQELHHIAPFEWFLQYILDFSCPRVSLLLYFCPPWKTYFRVYEKEKKRIPFVPKNNLFHPVERNFKMPIKACKVHWNTMFQRLDVSVQICRINEVKFRKINIKIAQTIFFKSPNFVVCTYLGESCFEVWKNKTKLYN